MNSRDDIYSVEGPERHSDDQPAPGPDRYASSAAGVARHCRNCGQMIDEIGGGNFCPGCGQPLRQMHHSSAPTSGFAIASLVMGILSIISCFFYGLPTIVFGPLAIVFASMARGQVASGAASPASLGLASAGRIMGIIGLSIVAAVILVVVIAFAFGIGSATP